MVGAQGLTGLYRLIRLFGPNYINLEAWNSTDCWKLWSQAYFKAFLRLTFGVGILIVATRWQHVPSVVCFHERPYIFRIVSF